MQEVGFIIWLPKEVTDGRDGWLSVPGRVHLWRQLRVRDVTLHLGDLRYVKCSFLPVTISRR